MRAKPGGEIELKGRRMVVHGRGGGGKGRVFGNGEVHRAGRSTVKEAGNGGTGGAGRSTDVRSGARAIDIFEREVGVGVIERFAIDGGVKLCLGVSNGVSLGIGSWGFHDFGALFIQLQATTMEALY